MVLLEETWKFSFFVPTLGTFPQSALKTSSFGFLFCNSANCKEMA